MYDLLYLVFPSVNCLQVSGKTNVAVREFLMFYLNEHSMIPFITENLVYSNIFSLNDSDFIFDLFIANLTCKEARWPGG